MPKKKNIKKNYQNKKTKKKGVNVDNNKENVYEKLILQDTDDDNIDFRWS